MFSRFLRNFRRDQRIAAAIYGAIVAQARSPALYADIGVPDTVSGRFEMVLLHVVMIARRLQAGGDAARAAGQGVFDHFCRDMDSSLREMGIGDLSVPKHMRRVGEAYFGRARAYEPGLANGQADRLAEAIERTVFAGDGRAASRALAAYALAAAEGLGRQADGDIVAGDPRFPDADQFAPGEIGR